jgi:hypothetical protein
MSVFTNPASGAAREADGYIRAVLELLGDRDPLETLKQTPTGLRRAIDGLSAQELGRPEKPGKWSIAAVLKHLEDSDLVWGYRLRATVSEDRPRLQGYDQDGWAAALRYEDRDAHEALDGFAILRRSNLHLLESLSPEQWKRAALHPERGEETIEHMARLYAGHDLVHLRQIDRIKEALGKGS